MAFKHVTTRQGLTSLAFAQLDPGRPRDPSYLHSVYTREF